MMPRVLMVDDDPKDIESILFALRRRGWNIKALEDSKQALAEIQQQSYDVLLIDRQMLDPETGRLRITVGDDLLEQVVALCPYVCPIILTHFSDPEAAIRAGRYGAFDYL